MPEIRTPDGDWRVEEIRTRPGEEFRIAAVRLSALMAELVGARWQIQKTVADVADLLGDAFEKLVDAN